MVFVVVADIVLVVVEVVRGHCQIGINRLDNIRFLIQQFHEVRVNHRCASHDFLKNDAK